MPRLISCSITKQQVIDRIKTVTRREGWLKLKAGDILWFVDKAMGLKKGEKVHKRALIRVLNVRRERLGDITQEDVVLEGFPDKDPAFFIELFIKSHPKTKSPDDIVTRIEYEYLDPPFTMKHKVSKNVQHVMGIDYNSQKALPYCFKGDEPHLSELKLIKVLDRPLSEQELSFVNSRGEQFLPSHLQGAYYLKERGMKLNVPPTQTLRITRKDGEPMSDEEIDNITKAFKEDTE